LTIDIGFDSIRCPACGLVQFCTFSTICKRCRRSLGSRYVPLTLSRINLEKDNSSEEVTRAFGDMMRGMGLDRGMTQAECALHLHTSRSHLSRLESGRLRPSFSMLLLEARAFAFDRVILRIRIPRTPPSKA
jgi:DNA-binding XRE family transcriptional regulator